MFIIKPVRSINGILNLLVEKTIALGGVEIGIINAQLAAKIIGKINCTEDKSLLMANVANIGSNKKVVAVLLVNSVSIEVKKVKNNKIKKKSYSIIKLRFFDRSSANPVETIIEAIDKPPPKSNSTFHGMSLNQEKFKSVFWFLSIGKIKNSIAHIIAIPESVRLIPKKELIAFLKIHEMEARINTKEEIFSFFEKLPRDLYFLIRLDLFIF